MAYDLWCAVKRYSSAMRSCGASSTGYVSLRGHMAYGLWCAVRRYSETLCGPAVPLARGV
eukprot:4830318-Prymnesium_polylepis.1